MGCGRVGASLALGLEERGHDVAVIDRERSAFRRLGPDFQGRRVHGIGFDRDSLAKAGIDHAYAFAAVSSGDNSNILAARVARETYGIDNVVARIYDPGRAEVYQRMGIPTVGTVRWTSDRIMRRLLPIGSVPIYTDPSGEIVMAEVPAHEKWIGRRMSQIEQACGARIAYYIRLDTGHIPTPDTVLQELDILHVVCRADELHAVESVLLDPPAAVD